MFNSYFVKMITILFSLSLLACQSTTSNNIDSIIQPTYLYLDDDFNTSQKIIIETEDDVFGLDEQMSAMVTNKLLPIRDPKKRANKLLRNIFANESVNLAYKSDANLIASEAYHSQKANCMSLTIMAYALAKEAGLNVKFQDIKVPEYWVRNGNYNMLTGHVNLVLTMPVSPNKLVVYGKELLQIDFDPAVYKKSFPKKVISKNTVLAMFYNNKGAQFLATKNYDHAYVYLKQATLVDPQFSSAWGNLGILYKLNNFHETAIKTYEHAIALDHDNLTALSNLALLLRDRGDFEQAGPIEKKLFKKRNSNPYFHALLADEAYFRGDNTLALSYYKKAIRMNKKVHEFYFGMAKVYYAQNKFNKAESALNKALSYNRISSIESQYIAKLNFLKQAHIDD